MTEVPRLDIPPLSLARKLKLVFVSLSLLAVIAMHIPALPLSVQAFGHGFTNLIGQEIRWTMFSADPRGTSLELWAELVFVDGRDEEWRIERGRPGGDLAFYHWIKWMETAVLDPQKAKLGGLADWLASEAPDSLREVVIYARQRPGLPPSEPLPSSEVTILGRFEVRSP